MVRKILDGFVRLCRDVCGTALTGAYLHGSLALGCFNPKKSDIDLLVVVDEPLDDRQKMHLIQGIVSLNALAPEKGIEMSVLLAADCKPFKYPTPFLLHFSPMHLGWWQRDPVDYVVHMNGTDRDLAAHVSVVNRCGVTLFGRPIPEAFGEVSRADYLDSVWSDVENAAEDILRDPMYITLNLCRALALVRDDTCLSKAEGAAWGLRRLPERFHPLIRIAADCYASAREMKTAGSEEDFARYMLAEIRRGGDLDEEVDR